MPSTLQTPKGTRCIRCATLIRNSRKNCPSCDLDLTASNSAPANGNGHSKSNSKVVSRVGSRVGSAVNPASDSSARNKNRAARAGMKLCPVCMSSVNESEMSESSGQMVCNACAVKLKNKPARAPLAAGAVTSNSAPPQMASKPEPEVRHVPTPGGKPIMGDDELLTAKGMQRQLMDKLLWIKVLVIIWGIVSMALGGLAYAAGSLGSAMVSSIDEDSANEIIEDKDFTDENGNKMTAEQIKAQRDKIREQTSKFRDEAKSALFKVKLVAGLSLFIGVSFFAAFFLMNSKPFEVCAIVTVLYVIYRIMDFAIVGEIGMLDIFITISILSTLVTGIRTGMRIKDIRERAEAATGRPVIG